MDKSCVILIGRDSELRQRVAELIGDTIQVHSTCINLGPSGKNEGFMDCDIDQRPVWYERQEGYNRLPLFDARHMMAELYEFLKGRKMETSNMIVDRCIIMVNTEEESEDVQKLAFKAGYSWNPVVLGKKKQEKVINLMENGYDAMGFGDWWGHGLSNQIVQGGFASLYAAKPDWTTISATSDMASVKLFFDKKLVRKVTIESLVKPKLLELIRSNPSDEIVVGFIRRDLQLALPKDVQNNGGDAICEWILKEKTEKQKDEKKATT